jgi:hypothetical protein
MELTSWVRFSKPRLPEGLAGHQLQVVDDDEVELALLLLQAAGLGAHLGQGDAGRVVDEDRASISRSSAFAACRGPRATWSRFAALRDPTRASLANMRRSRLSLRHFEREDGDDFAVLHGGVLRDVDGPGGLAHGGTRGDDDEFGVLQAAGHLVEDRCSAWPGR